MAQAKPNLITTTLSFQKVTKIPARQAHARGIDVETTCYCDYREEAVRT